MLLMDHPVMLVKETEMPCLLLLVVLVGLVVKV